MEDNMKKLLNYVLVVAILVAMLFALSGCGKEKVEGPVVEIEEGQTQEKEAEKKED